MSLDFYLYVDVDTGGEEPHRTDLCDKNITHNLTEMADKAGIYKCLWRPDENQCNRNSPQTTPNPQHTIIIAP